MVHLQRFHELYSSKGLLVFAISMFPYPDQARKATKELAVTYPVFDGHGSDLGEQYAYG